MEDGDNVDRAKERDKEHQYLRKETTIKGQGQLCPHSSAIELIPGAKVKVMIHKYIITRSSERTANVRS